MGLPESLAAFPAIASAHWLPAAPGLILMRICSLFEQIWMQFVELMLSRFLWFQYKSQERSAFCLKIFERLKQRDG